MRKEIVIMNKRKLISSELALVSVVVIGGCDRQTVTLDEQGDNQSSRMTAVIVERIRGW